MRRLLCLGLGMAAFVAVPALAVDKRANAGTLARAAIQARRARLAEPAKDGSPPKTRTTKPQGDYIEETRSVRIRFGR